MIFARLKPEQTLEEHIKLCLESLKHLSSTRLWRLFKNFENILKITIIFHDSGKIFYQDRVRRGKGFLGHELLSTFIVNEFLLHKDLNFSFDSRFLIDGIVLYHHYAMDLRKRKEKFLNEFRGSFIVCESEEKFMDLLKEHEKIVLDFLDLEKLDLEREVAKKAMRDVNNKILKYLNLKRCLLQYGWIFKDLEQINKEIWSRFVKEKDFRKLMLLGINAMTIVDYLGVRERRTEFSRIVEEFVSTYNLKFEPRSTI